jgi:hypothetical protein
LHQHTHTLYTTSFLTHTHIGPFFLRRRSRLSIRGL